MAFKAQYDFWIEDLYVIIVVFYVLIFMENIFFHVYLVLHPILKWNWEQSLSFTSSWTLEHPVCRKHGI